MRESYSEGEEGVLVECWCFEEVLVADLAELREELR